MQKFFTKKMIWIVSLIILLSVGLGIGFVIYSTPRIELIGNSEVRVAVNQAYVERGAKASVWGHDISDRIVIDSQVNASKLGVYKEKYSVKNLIFSDKIMRTIKVIDNIKPEIVLTGGNVSKLCPEEVFVEPGFTAIDNYDGDISKNVVVTKKDAEVVYSVKDSSNNSISVIRTIDRNDKEAPVITLKGSSTINLDVGSKYIESGYTVTDEYDKDIGSKVKITGAVNTGVIGSYILTYIATDCSGNAGKVERTIVVRVKAPPSQVGGNGSGSGKTIYLTFDDGSSYLTPQILDILNSEGVKATFFVIGTRRNDAVWKRMVNEGHTIAIHSDTHNYAQIYKSSTAFYNDLYAIKAKIKDATGVDSNIIRFPGGSSNNVSKQYSPGIMSFLVKDTQAKGFHYFDWNVGSSDTGKLTSAQIYSNVVNGLGTKQTCVVLMHDYPGNDTTRDAIRDIIKYGKSHGYKFSNITMSTPQIHHGVSN